MRWRHEAQSSAISVSDAEYRGRKRDINFTGNAFLSTSGNTSKSLKQEKRSC